jgi:hypothetical protein
MSEVTFLTVWAMLFGTVGYVASLRFLRRWLELKRQPPVTGAGDEMRDRLARIEQTVEATAVEVERLSEANRFMAKLLAERASAPITSGRPPERVITPH